MHVEESPEENRKLTGHVQSSENLQLYEIRVQDFTVDNIFFHGLGYSFICSEHSALHMYFVLLVFLQISKQIDNWLFIQTGYDIQPVFTILTELGCCSFSDRRLVYANIYEYIFHSQH